MIFVFDVDTALGFDGSAVAAPIAFALNRVIQKYPVILLTSHAAADIAPCLEKSWQEHLISSANAAERWQQLQSQVGHQDYVAFSGNPLDLEVLQNAKYALCVGNLTALQKVAHESLKPDAATIAARIEEFNF